MKKIKTNAVIFDMDGVITNSMPEHFISWKKVLKKEGINITQHEVYLREGQPGKQTVKELFALHNLRYSSNIGESILKRKENYFKQIIKTRYISGSRSLLKKLQRKKIRLALVTGTARHEMLKILPRSISNLFSIIVTGTDVKKGKPHPDPFLKALKLLKISPELGIVIENAPFGIESAKKAGLRTIAIETSLPKKYLTKADYIYKSLKDLESHLNFTYKGIS